MERHELIGLMRELKLAGMRAAYDEAMTVSAGGAAPPRSSAIS